MDIEPSLQDYQRVVKKRKWVILAVWSITVIATFVYNKIQTPLYRASAVVKFEPPAGRTVGQGVWDMEISLQTQVRMLHSAELAKLADKRISAPLRGKASYSASLVPDSNLIAITAVGPDPYAVAAVADTVVDVYAERDKEERSASSEKMLEDITARRQEVEASLRMLEDERRAYQEEHHTSGLGSSLGNQLTDLESRRAELLKKFTTEHPEVIAIDERIKSTRRRRAAAPVEDITLERMNRDIKVNEEIYITLSRQMEEAKVALASIPSFVTVLSRAEVPKKPFYPKKKTNYILGLLFGLVLGMMLAFVLENLDISISTIEELEKILGLPVLGVVPHLGQQRSWQQIKAALFRRKRYPMDVFRSLLLFQQSARSPMIEVYHSLRSNIEARIPDVKRKILVFTSTGVAEGKTLTAVNFCMAAANSGQRVLLIGADIRRPILYRIFGLPKLPGLIEVLKGEMPWAETLRGTVDYLMGEMDMDKLLNFPGIDNFKIMTGWSPNSTDVVKLFSSPAVSRLMEELREDFDLIVFDGPPVLLFVDSVLLGAQADGVVMIYKSGMIARQALCRANDQLTTAKAKIIGVVLNDMHSTDMEPRYGYYYDYGHYAKPEEA